MKCPFCDSENVHMAAFQSAAAQMKCKDCKLSGTFTEFGVPKSRNIGLANSPDEYDHSLEESFHQPDDITNVLRITVNSNAEHWIVNIWLCEWNQWLKLFPEQLLPKSQELQDVLKGVFVQLIHYPRFGNDTRAMLVIANLTAQANQL